jgi:hypothetical protein
MPSGGRSVRPLYRGGFKYEPGGCQRLGRAIEAGWAVHAVEKFFGYGG